MIIKKCSINSLLLFVFLFVCVFFPGDPYNIKIVDLLIILGVNSRVLIAELGKSKYRWILIFGFMFPIVVMLHSSILSGDAISAISNAYTLVILLLIVPAVKYDLKYQDKLITILYLLSLVIDGIAIADILGIININSQSFVRDSIYKYGMGMIGKSSAYSSYYRIFFSASPLLVIALDDAITRRKYLWVMISFLALYFSGTRGNVFSALIIIFLRYSVWNEGNKKNSFRIFIALVVIAFAAINLVNIVNMVSRLMNTSGSIASDIVRQGELSAYNEIFDDFGKLFFGSGFGSSFYNYGRNHFTYTSELSYLELIRCMGLLLSIPFFVFVFKPLFSKNVSRDIKLSYFCYLIIAATNPLLFSSTAMILYIFMYICIL